MHYQSESTEAYGCHLDTQEPYLWKLFCILTFESEVVSFKVFILQGIISPECSLWVRGGGREEHVQASGVSCTQNYWLEGITEIISSHILMLQMV